jgi:hypothetical protein
VGADPRKIFNHLHELPLDVALKAQHFTLGRLLHPLISIEDVFAGNEVVSAQGGTSWGL